MSTMEERFAARLSGEDEVEPETGSMEERFAARLQGAGQAEFDKKEAGKNPVSRLVGDAYRGATTGIRNNARALGGFIGDVGEQTGLVTAEQRDNPITMQKQDREPIFPHMSGSPVEKAFKFGGEMAIPGVGPGRTLLKTMAKASGLGFGIGSIHSDSESLAGKAVDGVKAGAAAAVGGGLFHIPRRGLASTTKKAKTLERALNAELGVGGRAESSRLSLAKRTGGPNEDIVNRTVAHLSQKWNARDPVKAQRLDQRVGDDVFETVLRKGYRDDPDALSAGLARFDDGRIPRDAVSVAERAAGGQRSPNAMDPNRVVARRATTGINQAGGAQGYGRPSPRNYGEAGAPQLEANLAPLKVKTANQPKRPGEKPKYTMGDIAPAAVGIASGNPMLAVPATLPLASKANKRRKYNQNAKRYRKLKNAPYEANRLDLSAISDPAIGRLISGDHKLQLKYQALVKEGNGKKIDDFLASLVAKASAMPETEDAP